MIAVARPKKKTMTRYSKPIAPNCGGSARRAERPGRTSSAPRVKKAAREGRNRGRSPGAAPLVHGDPQGHPHAGRARLDQTRRQAPRRTSTAPSTQGTASTGRSTTTSTTAPGTTSTGAGWRPPDGDWRVQGYIFHHKHKPPKHHFRGPGPKPPRRVAAATSAAAVAATAAGEQRPAGSYAGAFGVAQANRLLTRAGFGPGPGAGGRAGRDGPGRRGPVADPAERRRRSSPARPRSTTKATRSPPPTSGATTTSGGSTG